jgi:cysteine desulfurase
VRKVYLDNNATTPIDPCVFEAMAPYLKEHYGNPSSVHQFGRHVKVEIDKAREKVAKLLNADPSEIIFCSGGSESDNMAIKGVALTNLKGKRHIITSQVEHPAVLDSCRLLEKIGFEVTYVKVDQYGMVNPEAIREAIKDNTALISIQHSNNEVGTIQPIMEIGEIAREKNILFHSDAVQSFGKVPINVKDLNVDFISLSGHKINGPKGIGALYIKKGTPKLFPIISGGHHERNRRAGTENVPGIIGFGITCEMAEKKLASESKHLEGLRDSLHQKLKISIPKITLNGHLTERLPTTLNIGFECVEGESIIINLDLNGIAASTGSACSSGSLEPSHVLTAMGIPPEKIHGSIRFSFGKGNTEEDVNYVAEILPPIIKKIRGMSPLWNE